MEAFRGGETWMGRLPDKVVMAWSERRSLVRAERTGAAGIVDAGAEEINVPDPAR